MATFFVDGDPGCGPSNWNQSSHRGAFAPTDLDTDNWAESMKALGVSSAVLTAKHGCGFALWPTTAQLPDGSPYYYSVEPDMDVLQLFCESMEKHGIGHGFYYSLTNNMYLNVLSQTAGHYDPPLDRQVNVTQAEFEKIALHQLTELWTNYGNLTEVWFDGGYEQSMQAPLVRLLAKHQPTVLAFNGGGLVASASRWVGTEGNMDRVYYPGAPWSTYCCNSSIGTPCVVAHGNACDLNQPQDLYGGGGCAATGLAADALCNAFYPAAVDFTVQAGDRWFWMPPPQQLRPLSEMITAYHNTVGRNTVMELAFSIDRTGRVAPAHAALYDRLGTWIKNCYDKPVASTSLDQPAHSIWKPVTREKSWTLDLDASNTAVDRIMIQEDQTYGQRILAYEVTVTLENGSDILFSRGESVGNKRIDLRDANQTGAKHPVKGIFHLNIMVTAAALPPVVKRFAAFAPCSTGVKWWKYPYSLCKGGFELSYPAVGPSSTSCPGTENNRVPISRDCIDELKSACLRMGECGGFDTNLNFYNTSCLKSTSTQAGVSRTAEPIDLYLLAAHDPLTGHVVPQPVLSPIWPMPKSTIWGTTAVYLSASFAVHISSAGGCNGGAGSVVLKAAFDRFQPLWRPFSSATHALGRVTLPGITVCVQRDGDALGPDTKEDYSLWIPADGSHGTISASTVFGVLHALESFNMLIGMEPDTQLLNRGGGWGFDAGVIGVAPVNVTDEPRFAHRGLMIDTSRRFLPVATIEKLIDGLSMNKMNVLHWHISDSQSFPSSSKLFPQLALNGSWDKRAIYSTDDMKHVVLFARDRGVRVIPEWDIPGRGRWRGVPGLVEGCIGTNGGLFGGVLDPTSNQTYVFLREFFSEMGKIFTDPVMFFGGDAIDPSCFDQNAAIVQWMVQHGLNSSQLQDYFWSRFNDEVSTHLGKTPVLWESDVVPVALAHLPADTIVDVSQSQATVDQFVSAGVPVILSGGWALDSQCPGENHNAWKCMYNIEPREASYTDAEAKLVLGGEASMWGDDVNADNIEAFTWRGIVAIAERLWSPAASLTDPNMDYTPVARLSYHACRLRMRGLRMGPVQFGWCPADLNPSWNRSSSADLNLQAEVAQLRAENARLKQSIASM
jgi:hexosaminidase